MSTFSRLLVLSQADAEANRKQLKKGLLRSNLVAPPLGVRAGYQPLGSGLHFIRGRPIITQLPTEIQCMVLGYLEPIWLFQLEKAYKEVEKLLGEVQGNKIWYDSLPPALFIEPEYFQNERKIKHHFKNNESASLAVFRRLNQRSLSVMSDNEWHYASFRGNDYHIFLPRLSGLMDVAVVSESEFRRFDIDHPTNKSFYPVISSIYTPPRFRTLALGGPFVPSISYRSELLGHLHYNKRCYICFELLTGSKEMRPYVENWGMIWCKPCFAKWTLTPDQLKTVKGLEEIIVTNYREGKIDNKWIGRQRGICQCQWRPYIDDVLRNQIGLDFATSHAKEIYLDQISDTLTWYRRPLTKRRQQLRHEIIEIVRKIWTEWNSQKDQGVVQCSVFVTSDNISDFLFPVRLLDEKKQFFPYDPCEKWLHDPISDLNSSRMVQNRSMAWKTGIASTMLRRLLSSRMDRSSPTTFIQAADAYHVNRIKCSLSANGIIKLLNELSPAPANPFRRSHGLLNDLHRLEVMLSKLQIYRANYPNLPLLSERDSALAKDVFFKKLALQACIGCPCSGYLALPRGIEGVVAHYRCRHHHHYWSSNEWFIIG